MVLPPNLNNGIRGPDGVNLTDIDARLNDINGTLGQIRDTLSGFLGVPPGDWPGLLEYLYQVLGQPGTVIPILDLLTVINTSTTASRARLDALLVGLFGVTTNPTAAQLSAIRQQLTTREGSFVAADINNVAVNLQIVQDALLGRIVTLPFGRDRLRDISDVLGLIVNPPEGSTIKDLLRSLDVNVAAIEDCSCGETPPDGTLPPPTTGCLGSPPAWQLCTLELAFTTTGQAPFYDVYRVKWPDTITGNAEFGNVIVGGTTSGNPYLLSYTGEIDGVSRVRNVCVAWNFPTGSTIFNYDTYNGVADGLPFFAYNGRTPPIPLQGGESFPNTVLSTAAARRGIAWNIAVPQGGQTGNVYVQFGVTQPGGPS